MPNGLKLSEGAKVSCEAWRFDSPNEPKEDRWSYQTYGSKWRTARCEGVVRRALGKGQWEIQWSGREWRGRLDVMKTPQLRVEEEAAEEEEPPPPKKKAKEKEKAPETPRPKKETPPSQKKAKDDTPRAKRPAESSGGDDAKPAKRPVGRPKKVKSPADPKPSEAAAKEAEEAEEEEEEDAKLKAEVAAPSPLWRLPPAAAARVPEVAAAGTGAGSAIGGGRRGRGGGRDRRRLAASRGAEPRLLEWSGGEVTDGVQVDFKLGGAAAEGWRVMPRYLGQKARIWRHVLPVGARYITRAAIEAAVPGAPRPARRESVEAATVPAVGGPGIEGRPAGGRGRGDCRRRRSTRRRRARARRTNSRDGVDDGHERRGAAVGCPRGVGDPALARRRRARPPPPPNVAPSVSFVAALCRPALRLPAPSTARSWGRRRRRRRRREDAPSQRRRRRPAEAPAAAEATEAPAAAPTPGGGGSHV